MAEVTEAGKVQRKEAEEEETLDEEAEVRLWSWGAGSEGQLATGTLEDQSLPQPLHSFPQSHRIAHMACGGAHAIGLTRSGRVFTWGRGTRGQLGHGDFGNCLKPKLVKFLESYVISYTSAGWNHSGFVTDDGSLFMCGDGSFGQIGNGDNQSHSLPQEVLFFRSKHVEQVACGMRHSLVLVRGTSGSTIYGYGSGRHGQIGIHLSEGIRFICMPEIIHGFEDSTVIYLCANGDHSAALSAKGQLYTWGRGFNGSMDCHQPRVLNSVQRFSQIALGWNHALLVSDGEVYVLGRMLTHFAQTSGEQRAPDISAPSGIDEEGLAAPSLQKITSLDGERTLVIAAGAEHSAIVADKGTIRTWGWGEHGQLGLGNTDDQISPQRVGIGCKGSCSGARLGIYCGSGFTFLAKHD